MTRAAGGQAKRKPKGCALCGKARYLWFVATKPAKSGKISLIYLCSDCKGKAEAWGLLSTESVPN